MTADELSLLLQSLAPAVNAIVSRTVASLSDRIAALEQRPVRDGIDGRDGKDAEPLALEVVAARVAALLPPPREGETGPPGPQGERGTDAPPLTRAQVMDALQAMPDVLAAAVAEYLAAHPPAAGRDGVDGQDGADGRDGVGLAGALITQDGSLAVTLTNGTVQTLGLVVGRDGANGRDGLDGAPGAPGRDGRDGMDGLGFDDLTVDYDGERTIRCAFVQGDRRREFPPFVLPVAIWRGVYKAGESYQRGDLTTWSGSLWHCGEPTTSQPGQTKAWTLVAKRGADGKTGPAGPEGPRGPKGERGDPGPRGY